jgi:hypothetical protein
MVRGLVLLLGWVNGWERGGLRCLVRDWLKCWVNGCVGALGKVKTSDIGGNKEAGSKKSLESDLEKI